MKVKHILGRTFTVLAAAAMVGLTGALFASAASAQAAGSKATAANDTTQRQATNAGVTLLREVFAYSPAGRRDPFVSLAQTSDLRPLITDLQLVGILADPSGRRSVAILRDRSDQGRQYRVTVGSTLGRLRVTRITSRDVTFSIEEFGRNRLEVLGYPADSTRIRRP